MESKFAPGMPSFVLERRERRDERVTQRPHGKPSTAEHRNGPTVLRSVVLCISVAAGAFVASTPSGNVVAVGESVSTAAITSGLQHAIRLDTPPPREPTAVSEVQAVVNLVNAERVARGIAPVGYHEQLAQAARAHAADQFHRDCLTQLSHTGTDGSSPGDRVARTGLRVRTWGENVACGQRTPEQVMTAWMNSSGHRRNILSASFTHIGVSVSRDSDGRLYWVQVFGTPR